MTIIYVKTLLSALIGLLTGLAVVYLFNRIPAAWLCEYDEEPSEELQDRYIQRIKGWPWRWVYAGLFACIALRLVFTEINDPPGGFEGLPDHWVQIMSQSQFMLAGLFACFAMTIIGIADHKYMIIPDQFVIMLAVSALGFLPLYHDMIQPLGGLTIGGGVMLIVALIGKVAYKKDVMGMGDVKLCAAMGLALGIRGMLFVLAAGCFASGIQAGIGLAMKKYGKDDLKPLGPWLCAAGVFYIFILWPFWM